MQSHNVATPIALLSYTSFYVYKALVMATVYAIIKLIEQTLLTGYKPFDAILLRNHFLLPLSRPFSPVFITRNAPH